jgi:hypothetical protein
MELTDVCRTEQEIVAEAVKRRHPTGDDFAEALWRWSNRNSTPTDFACHVMRAAGYEPFQGFPLQRASR